MINQYQKTVFNWKMACKRRYDKNVERIKVMEKLGKGQIVMDTKAQNLKLKKQMEDLDGGKTP